MLEIAGGQGLEGRQAGLEGAGRARAYCAARRRGAPGLDRPVIYYLFQAGAGWTVCSGARAATLSYCERSRVVFVFVGFLNEVQDLFVLADLVVDQCGGLFSCAGAGRQGARFDA